MLGGPKRSACVLLLVCLWVVLLYQPVAASLFHPFAAREFGHPFHRRSYSGRPSPWDTGFRRPRPSHYPGRRSASPWEYEEYNHDRRRRAMNEQPQGEEQRPSPPDQRQEPHGVGFSPGQKADATRIPFEENQKLGQNIVIEENKENKEKQSESWLHRKEKESNLPSGSKLRMSEWEIKKRRDMETNDPLIVPLDERESSEEKVFSNEKFEGHEQR